MINITLQNNGPVQPVTYKNMYELKVEYMHGDADGTTYHTQRYSEDEDDEMLIDILGLLHSFQADSLEEALEDMPEIFESQGIEDAHDRVSDFRDTFYEGDITCEGRTAAIVGLDLWWYDNSGTKHDMKVLVNGKQI
jgi:hypothetical protein